MLTLNYFWFILVAFFFGDVVRRYAQSSKCGANPTFKNLSIIVSSLCMLANYVFVILGFWFMPHWWYPVVILVVDWLLIFVQASLPENVTRFLELVGLVIAPVFTVLAYLGMFGVI